MSYIEAIEAAGAAVSEVEYFGSYQGDIAALVTYEGVTGVLLMGYGSCSGCDHFEATFDSGERDACVEHRWDGQPDTCDACRAAAARFQARLADFGRQYLTDLTPVGSDEFFRLLDDYRDRASYGVDDSAVVTWLEARMTQVLG